MNFELSQMKQKAREKYNLFYVIRNETINNAIKGIWRDV
jgi:hypothetical protein